MGYTISNNCFKKLANQTMFSKTLAVNTEYLRLYVISKNETKCSLN